LVRVEPFEGIHYNTARFGRDITRFVAPPYDVIDPPMERKLKEDRLNIAHLTLGDEGDKYCVAARRLQTWLDDEVLLRDHGKSFYLYEQTYASPDGKVRIRSGIVGLVRLEEPSSGNIMPHEKTIPRHREDRLNLKKAVRGDLEQILLLYDDASGTIEDMILDSRKREEDLRFVDAEGVSHRIIRLADPRLVDKIRQLFEGVKLLIADGHHRYEVGLEYQRSLGRAEGDARDGRPCDYILGTLVSFRNSGLVVFPTHRLVKGVDSGLIDSLPKLLEKEFILQKCRSVEELVAEVEASSQGSFGAWVPINDTLLLATPRHIARPDDPLQTVPVCLVQEKVLKKLLKYTDDMLGTKTNIEYVKGVPQAKSAMESGEFQACFFVKPPSPAQVMAVAKTGKRMPHKSTYFFPKIWSGTLLYLH
jgi:uncharacterized protein (DUF1015 family)